ncbi:tail fiber domain-containing protein [Pantoea sp. WEP]|uniref:tail fiber domain-containing protein n=1 Tax=Pantoea sp. WEP TaxID=3230025 RepID=UPI003565ECE4
MPAGTIALTNNSATVTGTGTSFTTELKVNDFVVSTVGGVAYTLGVKSIESNTSLTLMENYTGPSASGQSWTPVPYGTMAAITAQLAAQVTYAVRGFNLDKVNWQQIFTGSGTVTVMLPDGTSWQGPAWNGIGSTITGKLDKSQNLNDLSDKGIARTNLGFIDGALPLNLGGTGKKLPFGTEANTFAQGNDSRLNTIEGKSGGTLTKSSTINFNADPVGTSNGTVNEVAMIRGVLNGRRGGEDSGGAAARLFLRETSGSDILAQLRVSGLNPGGASTVAGFNFLYTGVGQATTWQNLSDERLKENITTVDNALAAVLSWRGVTFDYRVSDEGYSGGPSVGLIEQDVEKWCPHAVSEIGTTYTFDGEAVTDAKALNTSGVSAAYHTEAIKMLFSLVELALSDPDEALKSIDAIKASVTTRD